MPSMTAKILQWKGITKLNLDPDRTLENLKGDLQGFILAGYDKEGNLFFSSTYADGGEALWLLEKMKHALMSIDE